MLFDALDRHGLPLEIAAIHLREKGIRPPFADFCRDAAAAGWAGRTIYAKVREAATTQELHECVLELLEDFRDEADLR